MNDKIIPSVKKDVGKHISIKLNILLVRSNIDKTGEILTNKVFRDLEIE